MLRSASLNIFSRLLDLPTKFFVDIGAANDPSESQSELLLQNGWSGVMFECDPEKFVPLAERMCDYPVTVISQKVTPDNVLEILQELRVPDGFYLSLDIDGYDFFVLQKILSVYKPQLIISEINEKIPPPIKFTVNYDPSYWWDVSHFYGYSLAMLEDVKGYKVESLDFNNVIMVPGTQEIPLTDIYRDGYLNMAKGTNIHEDPKASHGRPSYNADFDPIYTMSYGDQINFIKMKFEKFVGKYTLDGIIYKDVPKPKGIEMKVANTGQVQVNSPFGRWITKYASDPKFSRYLEIGTWNGQGSTCCFYEGFKNRRDTFALQSYEIAKDRVIEATNVWRGYSPIQIIHGRMLEDHECPTWAVVRAIHPSINVVWHTEDITNFWNCEYVAMNDPQVILLDGAEYLTWFEFEKMIATTKASVYLLDDTQTAKCPKILEWFAMHPEWKRVAGSDTERNGWAIYEL